MEKKDETGPLLIAAPLSLSGRYAFQGRLAAIGLAQAVKDVALLGGLPLGNRRLIPEIAIIDDESTRAGVRRALEKIARADLLIGPYGSDLVGEAARWVGQKGRVLWNHGGMRRRCPASSRSDLGHLAREQLFPPDPRGPFAIAPTGARAPGGGSRFLSRGGGQGSPRSCEPAGHGCRNGCARRGARLA